MLKSLHFHTYCGALIKLPVTCSKEGAIIKHVISEGCAIFYIFTDKILHFPAFLWFIDFIYIYIYIQITNKIIPGQYREMGVLLQLGSDTSLWVKLRQSSCSY